MRPAAALLLSAALGMLSACSSADSPQETASAPARAPLYDNLGSYHVAITTKSPDAQRYFDQGLVLSYAFNHAEAIRSFRQALEIDPSCAMCYWGIAYALGPNINAPITEDAAREAWQAIEQARKLESGVSERERAYINALAARYTADPKAERAPLDAAYAEAMRGVAKQFPDDLDAQTLFAQSLMDTSPWNYWNADGSPRPFTSDVVSSLESVLKRNPDHIGAIHLYIHAVEASPDPKRAEPYADKLGALVPGAGHLVHMPAHVYLRVGRFGDATAVNEQAVKADEAYFTKDRAQGNMMYEVGYYPHNIHFMVASASLEGRRTEAMSAAETVREKAAAHPEMLKDPAMTGMMQHYMLTPFYTKIRFELWDQVLAEPEPAADLVFTRAIWHAGRGIAFAATGKPQDAARERTAMVALKDDPSLKQTYVSSVNTASSIVAIAYEVLEAEIAAHGRRTNDAVRRFAAAVKLEDGLTYMEPPDWPIPVRQLQGAALLALGRARDAQAAFEGDMRKFPENGWSLRGLQASLERQGRTRDAAAVKARLDKAWARADIRN
jgi:tetratricopeptide (TPR) repeat protein